MKDNVIITMVDEKYGDFLINHWIVSLEENVNLKNIDIVVLDYGLNKNQQKKLQKKNIHLIKCEYNGAIVIIRFRDILNFLKSYKYKQVMICDGGDIIFQKDISNIFYFNRDKFKGVCENKGFEFDRWLNLDKNINPKVKEEMRKFLFNKKVINAGVLWAPRKKFMKMCKFCIQNIKNKNEFGPDQITINYLLYKEGFVELDQLYNFIMYTSKSGFKVKRGKFYNQLGQLIAIVHNAGRFSFVRAIKNFGYGKNFNQTKFITYFTGRMLIKISNILFPLKN